MRKTILLAIFTLLSLKFSLACSCSYAGDFCEIYTAVINNDEVLIVQGYPDKIIGHGMTFKVDKVISGQDDIPKKITVWGDSGYLCRTYVTGFKKGDQLILILAPITQDRTERVTGLTEKVGDYTISVCGEFFVYLNGEQAQNPECVDFSEEKPFPITSFPNPTNDFFSIEIETETIEGIKVFGMDGKLIFSKEQLTLLQEKNKLQIETHHWIVGIYLVEIKMTDRTWIAKVVKI